MNQDKTFSGELVLLVFVSHSWEICSPVPLDAFIGAGGCLHRWGEKSIYAFCKSRPSYLQIASIHSLVSGMDSCLSRSKVTMMDLQNTFHLIGFRINDLLNQMKAFGTYLRDGGLYSDVVRCENLLDKIRFDMNNDNANLFPNLLPGIPNRSIQSFPSRKRRSKLCC